MRLLVVGGTRFVGRHVAAAALAAGHDVSLLHRGRTGTDLFPEAEHLLADRNGDLGVLHGRSFDATVDVSAYRPRQVRALAEALHGRGGHYAFVSSTAVYRPPARAGFDEDSPLVDPADPEVEDITDQSYGPLKVACELAATEVFGPDRLVVRPTYVVGPWDYTGRFTYWVERLARGGEVLAPGPPESPVQVVDARDLGRWMVSCAERRLAGTFHAVSPPPVFTFAQLLDAIAAEVAPAGTRLRWVDAAALRAAGLDDRALPLWGGDDPFAPVNTADPARAVAAGLSVRPLARTVRDTYADAATVLVPGVGLDAATERSLLQG